MTPDKKPSPALWLLVPLAGLMLQAGFENFPLSKFVFLVSGIPLIFFLYFCKGAWRAFLGGLGVGFVFFAANFRWPLLVYPLEWAGIAEGWRPLLLVGAIWVASALILGAGIALFSLAFKLLKSNSWNDVLFAPFLWVVFEFARPYLFETLWWSPETLWGPHWTNGSLGYLLINTPLETIARIAGIYGLSFVVIFINFFIVHLFAGKRIAVIERAEYRQDNAAMITASILALAMVLVPTLYRPEGTSPQNMERDAIYVSTLQTYDSTVFSLSDFSALAENDETLRDNPKLPHAIVLPEDARLFALSGPRELEALRALFSDRERGGYVVTNAHKQNKVVSIVKDKTGETLAEIEKSFLVPFGEYLPSVIEKAVRGLFGNDIPNAFARLRKKIKAERVEEVFFGARSAWGILSCSGVGSATLYRDLSQQGAEILFNQASYTTFKNSPYMQNQIVAMARLQAIANNRYFVQSSHESPSFILDNNGEIVNIGVVGADQFVSGVVRPIRDNTPFVVYGNWIVYAGALLILLKIIWFVMIKIAGERKKSSVSFQQNV